MASIQSVMLLEDKMTKPLMNIDNSLSVVTDSIERTQAAALTMFGAALLTVAKAQFDAVKMAVDGIGAGIERAINEQSKLNQTSEKLTEEINESSSAYDAIKEKLSGVADLIKEAFSIEKIAGMSDQMVQTSARLNLMNDGMQSTKELQDMIYRSAQSTGTAYQTTADRVAGLSSNARDVFNSTAETVDFAELVSKQFAIAGASTEDTNSAFSQLTQSLSTGVMSGEDLNSLFAAAPNMIQTIADYLNVPVDKLEDIAAGGQLTADIVKNAMLSSTDDINNKFNSMPMTWEQVGNTIKNQGLMAIQPILEKFSEIANNPSFQEFAAGIVGAMSNVVGILVWVLDLAISVGSVISDNWSTIGPVIFGIGAALAIYATYLALANGLETISKGIKTASIVLQYAFATATGTAMSATTAQEAAQRGLNGALLASPLTWMLFILIAIIAAIYAVVEVINTVTGSTISATGIICGAIMWLLALIVNAVIGTINAIIQYLFTRFVEPFIGIIEWILNVCMGGFDSFGGAVANLIGQIISWFLSLGKIVTKIIDAIFGTDWTSTLNSWQDDVLGWGKNDNAITLSREAPQIDYRLNMTDAYNNGYDSGSKIGSVSDVMDNNSTMPEFNPDQVTDNVAGTMPTTTDLAGTQAGTDLGSTAENTANIAKSVSDSTEEIKYLRDVAEREVINRFTTAEIKVNMGGIHNKVNKNTDLDGVVNHLENQLYESLNSTAEQYNS